MGHAFSIVHLSDLHFGRIQPNILTHLDEFLVKRKNEIKLAILTGDITQRARKQEFLEAIEFIKSLSHPLFVVPGNHDVPLYNLFLRFFSPYKKFLRYMGPFAKNFYEDEHVAIYGLWTVDNFSIQTGRLSSKDLADIEAKFRDVPTHKIKIIACHHPLMSINHPRIKNDLQRLMNLKPHFFLWGHEHQSAITPIEETATFPMILASGTTTSTRTRNEANSFNYMLFNDHELSIEVYRHSHLLGGFEVIDRQTFDLSA